MATFDARACGTQIVRSAFFGNQDSIIISFPPGYSSRRGTRQPRPAGLIYETFRFHTQMSFRTNFLISSSAITVGQCTALSRSSKCAEKKKKKEIEPNRGTVARSERNLA